MKPASEISAFIIAGGKSRRFGSDKTLYEYQGKPLIRRVYDAVRPLFERVSIIADDAEKFSFLGLNVYPDLIQGQGPIGGIHTALKNSSGGRAFIFAADMPFLKSDFIEYMAGLPDYYDIIVPAPDGFFEPLHAVYSASLIPVIEEMIASGIVKISSLFERENVRLVGDDEILYYDETCRMFANINRIDDIKKCSTGKT